MRILNSVQNSIHLRERSQIKTSGVHTQHHFLFLPLQKRKSKNTPLSCDMNLCKTGGKAFSELTNKRRLSWLSVLCFPCIKHATNVYCPRLSQETTMFNRMYTFFAQTDLKSNSWTYNFAEVSGHNIESSQTWGFVYNVYITKSPNHFCLRGGGGGGEYNWFCGAQWNGQTANN